VKVLDESRSGGTSHYTVEPDSASDLQPTEDFRMFVRDLSWEPVLTALSLKQFQHKIERAFTAEHTETSAAESASDETARDASGLLRHQASPNDLHDDPT